MAVRTLSAATAKAGSLVRQRVLNTTITSHRQFGSSRVGRYPENFPRRWLYARRAGASCFIQNIGTWPT